MDKPITVEAKTDTFLATTPVKPMESEKVKKTQKEIQKIAEEIDQALDRPMPKDFFEDDKKERLEREIKEKIRIWEKNRQALFDLAGLLYILKTDKENSVTSASLFYRVLNNLEDPEITISYKGGSLLDTNRELSREIESLSKQYSEILPEAKDYFKKIRSKNIDGYLFQSYIVDDNGNNIHWYDKSYNLINSLIAAKQIKWIKGLLTSNIKSTSRLEMLNSLILSNKVFLKNLVNAEGDQPDSIYPEIWNSDDSEEAKGKLVDTINDLIKAWARGKILGIEDEYTIVRVMNKYNVAFLQENGIIDFVKDLTYSSEYGEVAVPATILKKTDSLYYIDSFYDTESYQTLSPRIRQNTDRFLIQEVIAEHCSDIDVLIKLKNFKITDENVQEIIQALSERFDKVPEWLINNICNEIEKKSQTPKEYRRAKQYAAQIRDSFDPQELEKQRKEFVLRLINMNESLQEQVPGKMKIKDLQFKIN